MGAIDFFIHGLDIDVLGDVHAANNTIESSLGPKIVFADDHNPLEVEIAKDSAQRIVNVWGKALQMQLVQINGAHDPVPGGVLPIRNPFDVADAETGYYLVDTAILVHGKTSVERGLNKDFWISARNTAILTGALSIVALATAVAVLAIATSSVALVAASITAFVTPFFAGFSFYRAIQANEQLEQWSLDPARAIADKRAQAYQNGFFYLVDHSLGRDGNNDVLFPAEVKFIYNKNFEAQRRAFENAADLPAKAKVLADFVARCVLSTKTIEYISEEGTVETAPEELRVAHDHYKALCQKVARVDDYLSQKKAEVEGFHDGFRQQLNREKESHLKTYNDALETRQGEIDNHYRPSLEQLRKQLQELPIVADRDPKRDEVNRTRTQLEDQIERTTKEWTEETRSLNTVYEAFIAPITNWHRAEMTRLNAWRDGQIQMIVGHTDDYIEPFFQIAKLILDTAYAAFKGQELIPAPISEHADDFIHILNFELVALPGQALQQRPADDRPGYREFQQALDDAEAL